MHQPASASASASRASPADREITNTANQNIETQILHRLGLKSNPSRPHPIDCHLRHENLHSKKLTRHKRISTSTRVRNNTCQLIIFIEDHPVGARGAPVVEVPIPHNRELVVWCRHGKVETLVVIVLVGIVVFSDLFAFGVVVVALLLGSVHRRGRIADAAAGVGAGSLACLVQWRGNGDGESGQCEELLNTLR